jgi:hypothetical protein
LIDTSINAESKKVEMVPPRFSDYFSYKKYYAVTHSLTLLRFHKIRPRFLARATLLGAEDRRRSGAIAADPRWRRTLPSPG